MKKLLSICAISSYAFNFSLAAEPKQLNLNNFYISVPVGYSSVIQQKNKNSMYEGNFNNSLIYGFGLGYDFNDFRAGVNYITHSNLNYRKKTIIIFERNDYQDIKAQGILFDLYKDFRNETKITPFVFVGLGVSKITSKNYFSVLDINSNKLVLSTRGGKNHSLTWQVGLGTSIQLSDNSFLDFKYSYSHLGKMVVYDPAYQDQKSEKIKFRADEFVIGFRYKIN